MKGRILSISALVMAFGAFPAFSSVAMNHSKVTQDSKTAIQSQQDEQNKQAAVKTFTGVIAKSGEKFVLRDGSSNAAYQLDDQDNASKFEGKKVRVTGTLDGSNNTIHVQAIDAA